MMSIEIDDLKTIATSVFEEQKLVRVTGLSHFEQGYLAGAIGLSRTSNPYPKQDSHHIPWDLGRWKFNNEWRRKV